MQRSLWTALLALGAPQPCGAAYHSLRSSVLAVNETSLEEPRNPTGAAQSEETLVAHVLKNDTVQFSVVGGGLHAAHASNRSNRSNASVPFNPRDYSPEVGKVFVFYYSHTSGELATQVEVRNFKTLDKAPPSDPAVWEPSSGRLVERGSCNLRLTPHVSLPSDMRKTNLRLAELAVCQAFFGDPCHGAPGCEMEIWAPLPYSNDQEPYIGAGMALVAHSMLCTLRVEQWQRDSCAIQQSVAAISAGLHLEGTKVMLRPLPSPWVDLKLDACYSLGFREAVFASPNRGHYLDGEHYATKHDVLAWPTTPPEAVFCPDLHCLVQRFER